MRRVPDDAYGEIEAALQSLAPSQALGMVSNERLGPEMSALSIVTLLSPRQLPARCGPGAQALAPVDDGRCEDVRHRILQEARAGLESSRWSAPGSLRNPDRGDLQIPAKAGWFMASQRNSDGSVNTRWKWRTGRSRERR